MQCPSCLGCSASDRCLETELPPCSAFFGVFSLFISLKQGSENPLTGWEIAEIQEKHFPWQVIQNWYLLHLITIRFLGWEDLLEKGKATHSSILAWRNHGLYSPWGHKESDTTERLCFFDHIPHTDTLHKCQLYHMATTATKLAPPGPAPSLTDSVFPRFSSCQVNL